MISFPLHLILHDVEIMASLVVDGDLITYILSFYIAPTVTAAAVKEGIRTIYSQRCTVPHVDLFLFGQPCCIC